MSEPGVDPREELQRVDEDLTRARQRLTELRSDMGDGADTGDAVDGATLLTEHDEQQALVDLLEARRERLTAQLGID